MTNKQRDDLLISISRSLVDFRAESRENLKNTENNLRSEFKQELKNTENNLRSEFKQDIENLRSEFKQDIGNLRSELKQDIGDLRSEVYVAIEKSSSELKQCIADNVGGAVEIIHDTWNRLQKTEKRVDSHDKEVANLKSRLA